MPFESDSGSKREASWRAGQLVRSSTQTRAWQSVPLTRYVRNSACLGTMSPAMPKRKDHAKLIVVDLDTQTMKAYEGGEVIFDFHCVTGSKDHPTDPGHYRVLYRDKNRVSAKYHVPMHWALFFTHDGKAFHQYHGAVPLSIVRTLKEHVTDYLGSHGCVRLVEKDAKALYEWADTRTKVHVEGRLT